MVCHSHHEEELCDQFSWCALSSAFLRRCNVDSAFLKSGRCLTVIVSEPTRFERIHQLPRYTSSSSCGNMGVVFVRQSVHLTDHFFNATQFEHSLSEPCITNEPIVNAQELSFLTLLLEFIRSVVFFTSFLPVPVTVWQALPDVKVRDREEIQHGLDVLLVFCCIISQEVPARAVDDMPASQYVRHALHCDFGSTLTISHSSVFPAAIIASFDSLLKGLNARCC